MNRYVVHVPHGTLEKTKKTFEEANFFRETDRVAYFEHLRDTVEVTIVYGD